MDHQSPAISNPDVLRHVVDVHVHPTDSEISSEEMDNLTIKICAMATRKTDQILVRKLAVKYPDKVVPCFGYHPWFTHQIAIKPAISKEKHYKDLLLPQIPTTEDLDAFSRLLATLPDPIPLQDIISEVHSNLSSFPNAMLGEVGIDRAARIPYDYHSSPRELTPFYIPIDHQIYILEAQLALAVELQRNVSVHSVKCQQATLDLLNRMNQKYGDSWLGISIDLHSCGLSPQMWKDIEKRHINAFLSLSTVINTRSPNHKQLILSASPNRLLVESDFHDIRFSTPYTVSMLKIVAEVKGWAIEDDWNDDIPESEWGVVRRLEANWKAFVAAKHVRPNQTSGRNRRFEQDWVSGDESE